uniref:Putative secreted protein n=1 Tax=Ixodes ricinus TaxID=34613 RepID=A0A6B0UIV3_IXORI
MRRRRWIGSRGDSIARLPLCSSLSWPSTLCAVGHVDPAAARSYHSILEALPPKSFRKKPSSSSVPYAASTPSRSTAPSGPAHGPSQSCECASLCGTNKTDLGSGWSASV